MHLVRRGYFGSGLEPIGALVLLLVALMARPEGIFARPAAQAGLTVHAPPALRSPRLPRQPLLRHLPVALAAGVVLYEVTLHLSSYDDYQVGEIARTSWPSQA